MNKDKQKNIRVCIGAAFWGRLILLVWVSFCGCCSVSEDACLACVCVRLMLMQMVLFMLLPLILIVPMIKLLVLMTLWMLVMIRRLMVITISTSK